MVNFFVIGFISSLWKGNPVFEKTFSGAQPVSLFSHWKIIPLNENPASACPLPLFFHAGQIGRRQTEHRCIEFRFSWWKIPDARVQRQRPSHFCVASQSPERPWHFSPSCGPSIWIELKSDCDEARSKYFSFFPEIKFCEDDSAR